MLQQKLRALFHPERYHGWGKTKQYFEGWYYKVISADEQYAFAFIPGIAMDNDGNQHAFVQMLDGKNLKAEYTTFSVDEFTSSSKCFKTEIGDNCFELDQMTLDMPNVRGQLRFKGQVSWPSQWYSPGIMGPYAFVPFMECYHGILSMDHTIEGTLEINGQTIDFTRGRGYIEKDWGRSFPSAYLWMQSNHFSQPGTSFKASVANIPWLGSSFVGFIAGLYFKKQLIQFTTYNKTKLLRSYADQKGVTLIMANNKYQLEVQAERYDATELASPINGFMDGRISESMISTIELRLFDKKTKQLIFEDKGRNTALEVAGNIEELFIGHP